MTNYKKIITDYLKEQTPHFFELNQCDFQETEENHNPRIFEISGLYSLIRLGYANIAVVEEGTMEEFFIYAFGENSTKREEVCNIDIEMFNGVAIVTFNTKEQASKIAEYKETWEVSKS